MWVRTFCSTFHGTGKDILIQFRTLSVCMCVSVYMYTVSVATLRHCTQLSPINTDIPIKHTSRPHDQLTACERQYTLNRTASFNQIKLSYEI